MIKEIRDAVNMQTIMGLSIAQAIDTGNTSGLIEMIHYQAIQDEKAMYRIIGEPLTTRILKMF